MIVTYTPADSDKRSWNYTAAELPSADAEDIEEAVGVTFGEWQQKLLQGGMRARRALLWILRRRDEPSLRFKDVSFSVGELSLDFDEDEKVRVRAEVEKSSDLSDEDRQHALRLLSDDEDGGGLGKDNSTPASRSAASE